MTQPDLIPQPWASNGSHATIPETTSEVGRASWSLGFPPETALPLNAGGIPPHWLDFQGVLYALSHHAMFEQAGGRYTWDSGINYPQGACIIGSDGTVYQALQESGPGTTPGAKNPTASGNTAYWGAMATPDGETIGLTNGRLALQIPGAANLLADGTTIVVDPNGKLSAVAQGADAASLADGKTTVANDGKLTVDLTNATAAALRKISQYVAKTGGGLKMDQSTGRLVVDFTLMPTDAFEALLASLRIPIWIDGVDVGTEFYVNGSSGVDTLSDKYGRSAAKPWRTIGFATESIAQNYNVNTQSVHINVSAGTYNEYNISLPMLSRTTGSVTIRPASSSDTVNVVGAITGDDDVFLHTGGLWVLEDLNIKMVLGQQPASGTTYPAIVASSDDTGEVVIDRCNLAFEDNTSSGRATVSARMIAANGGRIRIRNSGSTRNETTWSGTKGQAQIYWLHAEQLGIIEVPRKSATVFQVSGSFTAFCYLLSKGMYSTLGSGTPVSYTGISSPTGQQYNIQGGSSASTGTGGSYSGYFPGDSAGSVDSTTYCWIN